MPPTPKAEERQYLNLLLDNALLKRIDDFRFKFRFQSRTEAIRWLLAWAIDQKPHPEAE